MGQEFDARDFAELASELHAASSVSETADQVVAFARNQLDADSACVTMFRNSSVLETIVSTDPVAEAVDRLQTELGEGHCLDPDWGGEALWSQSVATDRRWPRLGPRVAELGIASLLAVSMSQVDGKRIGALNLYWAESRMFDHDDVAFAHVFGRHAAVALSATLRESNLHVALDTRKRIGQAQGILMERYDLDENQAFQVLRRYSQDHNRKLREIAEQLVRSGRLPHDPRGRSL